MNTNMLRTKMLVGTTVLLVLASWVPVSLAEDISRARTSDGDCVLVAWTAQPYVLSRTTGCTPSDPCVYVNWTTTPPTAAVGDC